MQHNYLLAILRKLEGLYWAQQYRPVITSSIWPRNLLWTTIQIASMVMCEEGGQEDISNGIRNDIWFSPLTSEKFVTHIMIIITKFVIGQVCNPICSSGRRIVNFGGDSMNKCGLLHINNEGTLRAVQLWDTLKLLPSPAGGENYFQAVNNIICDINSIFIINMVL